jgi:nucleotide-binding universal stress UspA family protein
MHAPSKILVAVDFTKPSRAALDYAVALAAPLGANVDVLHVWKPDGLSASGSGLLSDFVRSDPGKAMVEWLAPLERDHDVQAHGRLAVSEGASVSDTIVDVAQEGAYDLVVLGTSRETRFTHLLHGSVTERVARRAPCPVLTVGTEDAANDVSDDPIEDAPWLSGWLE